MAEADASRSVLEPIVSRQAKPKLRPGMFRYQIYDAERPKNPLAVTLIPVRNPFGFEGGPNTAFDLSHRCPTMWLVDERASGLFVNSHASTKNFPGPSPIRRRRR